MSWDELVPGELIGTGPCAWRGSPRDTPGATQSPSPCRAHVDALPGSPNLACRQILAGDSSWTALCHTLATSPMESVSWVFCLGREMLAGPAPSPPASQASPPPLPSASPPDSGEHYVTWTKVGHTQRPVLTLQSRGAAARRSRSQTGIWPTPFPPPKMGSGPCRLPLASDPTLRAHACPRPLLPGPHHGHLLHLRPLLIQQAASLHSEVPSEPAGTCVSSPTARSELDASGAVLQVGAACERPMSCPGMRGWGAGPGGSLRSGLGTPVLPPCLWL